MSHTVNTDSSFDMIEEIPNDDGIDSTVLPGTLTNLGAKDMVQGFVPEQPSTSRGNRSSKSSVKSLSGNTTISPTHLPTSSTSLGPSTSKGGSSHHQNQSMIVNNFFEVSSDTSSAAGFKLDHTAVNSPLASPLYYKSLPSSPGGAHHRSKSLTPEIEPINEDTADSSVVPDLQASNIRSPVISASNASNIDYLLSLLPPAELTDMPVDDPIVIRGNGNMTLFGLSNSFTNSFPSSLLGRVSREEFEYTMGRINHLLRQQHSTNAKFLLLGCLCCCCSLGCSLLWPTFALSKRTRNSLEKLIAMENSRLYNKLGLNWRLTKQHCHTNHSFMEYIIVIDFLPKMQIYQPD